MELAIFFTRKKGTACRTFAFVAVSVLVPAFMVQPPDSGRAFGPIQALANRSHSIRRYRYYRMLGQRTETQTEHWAGARVHRRAAGAICASGLPPGRAEFARCDAEGFYFSAERQAHKPFGPARESGAGEFLGDVVPALRRGNSVIEGAAAADWVAWGHGAGRERGRRSAGLRRIFEDLPDSVPYFSRYFEADSCAIWHLYVSGHLRDRAQWKARPQDRGAAGLDQPGDDGLH